jgi:outer membrane protein assembly factor BamB/Spy/CpxP family protein refolding chaperone
MFARSTFVVGLSIVWLPALAGSDWPQFRGPNGSATSAETALPAKWAADQNVAWKAKVPGYGWSSPIVSGDKVFVTTAITDNQRKPSGGFGGGRGGGSADGEGGGGGRPGGDRPAGFGGPPPAGQVLSAFTQQRLNLTAEQKKNLGELQKDVDGKLAKLLTDEQNKQLKEPPQRGAPGGAGRGAGGRGGAGGFGGFAQPGQILSPGLQERLKLTADQKKQLDELQKDIDGKLAKILTEEQNKQLKDMQQGGGRGGRGGFGGAGGGAGGFGNPPQPGQILSAFTQQRLNVTADQKKQLDELQKDVDGKLAKMLSDEQKKQLKESPQGGGRGAGGRGEAGRGGAGGRGAGGFGGFSPPGQILSTALQDRLKLAAEQKKQLEDLQKDVDTKLAKILTEEQNKQLKDMRQGGGRGFGGPGGGFGRQQRAPDAVYKWEIYCLNAADGKVLWKQTAVEQKPTIPAHPSNGYATETPVTDGERVYAYFGMTGVFCYDITGKFLWKVNLGSYRVAMGYGTGSSPVAHDGRLFVQCDNDEKSFLVALDGKTGKQLWRAERPEKSSWSTPIIWKNKVRTEIVCLGSPRVRSYDPASGKQLWEMAGLTGQVKASAVASDEMLYLGTGGGFGGFGQGEGAPGEEAPGGGAAGGGRGGRGGRGAMGGGKPLFAVKAGAAGDITLKEGAKSNDGVAWFLPQAGPSTASPLLLGDYLYVLEERNGLLSCYNAKTGKQVYKERLPGARGFTSSPWAYDGKVFCLDDSGTTHVIQAGPAFKVLGKNSLNEMCWASPAVGGGALFLRTVDALYCIKP